MCIRDRNLGKKEFYERIRALLSDELGELGRDMDLVGKRYERFRRIGVCAETE